MVLEVFPSLYTFKLQFLLVYVLKRKVFNTTERLVNIMTTNLRITWASAVRGDVWDIEGYTADLTGRPHRSNIHWRRIVQCDNNCMVRCKSDLRLGGSERALKNGVAGCYRLQHVLQFRNRGTSSDENSPEMSIGNGGTPGRMPRGRIKNRYLWWREGICKE